MTISHISQFPRARSDVLLLSSRQSRTQRLISFINEKEVEAVNLTSRLKLPSANQLINNFFAAIVY